MSRVVTVGAEQPSHRQLRGQVVHQTLGGRTVTGPSSQVEFLPPGSVLGMLFRSDHRTLVHLTVPGRVPHHGCPRPEWGEGNEHSVCSLLGAR